MKLYLLIRRAKPRLRFLLLFVSLFGLPHIAQAQQQKGIPSDGRDFYLGFMPPSIKCQPVQPFINVFALITTYDDNVVKISYFDDNGREIPGKNYVIQGKHSVQVQLDRYSMRPQDNNGEVPEYRACHISSRQPINVQYYSTGPGSGGMYLALPTAALGTQYVIASVNANPGVGAGGARFGCNSTYLDSNSSEFMVISAYDHTKVTITPNGSTLKNHPGATTGSRAVGQPQPYSVELMRGQVFWVKSEQNDNSVDESTSEVTSDKPCAVISGNEGAYFGDSHNSVQPQRDLTVEQMVPVDYWDGQDNLSMPFVDSPTPKNGDDNVGEAYRLYTAEPGGSAINFGIDGVTTFQRRVNQYDPNPTQFDNVASGINASTTDGTQIFAEQYDYRQHNQQDPYPTPSQMNVVPISRWRKSFLWMIPDDKVQVHKRHFINVLAVPSAFNHIMLSKDGGSPKPISAYSTSGKFANFPGHCLTCAVPIQGKRIELGPGSYYATVDSVSNQPFMIYQYGYLGVDPDNDLGDNDDDDEYFSYASPCGQSFGIEGSGNPSINVDTNCSSWTFHVSDSSSFDKGLAEVDLLIDPKGVYTRPGKVSYNTILDPNGYQVNSGDLTATFNVKVINPLQDAYAAVFVVNRAGNDTVVELYYRAPKLTLTPDSADFHLVTINGQVCVNFVLKNVGKTGDRIFTVTGADLLLNDGNFSLSSFTPKLPYSLKPGDSVQFTGCFTAKDTGITHYDSIIVHTDCFDAPVPLQGTGVTPLIKATDYDFGYVVIGQKKCAQITITNVGEADLLLTKNWLLSDTVNFSFGDDALLPVTLQPGKSITLTFCYHPKKVGTDSARCDWGTNLVSPFLHQIKDFSMLYGKASKSNVLWLRSIIKDTVICEQADTIRHIYVKNYGNADAVIDSLKFVGPDAAEYRIIAVQNNYPLPIYHEPLGQQDSLWVDIVFTPDLTKPVPARWANRQATLITTTLTGDTTTVDFLSTVLHADLQLSINSIDFGIVPIGVLESKQIILSNPGTAPLDISAITFPIQPIQSISNLNVGDVIPPGGTDTIIVNAELFDPTDTIVTFEIDALTMCPPPGVVTVHIAAATLSVSGTGKIFDSTFLYCHLDSGVTVFKNLGSTPVTLIKAEILPDSTSPSTSDPSQFAFVNGTHSDSVGVLLPAFTGTYPFTIFYTPNQTDIKTALIKYTWDTSGVRWTTYAKLQGTGVLLLDTLSAQAVDQKPIMAKTGDVFDLPIRLVGGLPPTGGVYGVRFSVNFREDLFHYINTTPPPGFTFPSQPVETRLANGFYRVTVTEMSTKPITTEPIAATLRLQLMVAKDLSSDFTITGAAYLDQNQDSVCYVLNTNVPGSFTPIDLCGDPTTRAFLNGNLQSAVIAYVIPNPARQSATVRFDVNLQNAPVTLEIYNMLGEKVKTVLRAVPYSIGSFIARVDLSDLSSGLYSVRLTTHEWTEARTLLISK